MTSPPTSTANGKSVTRCPSIARRPSTTAPNTCKAMPRAVGRPDPLVNVHFTPFHTLTFGSACSALIPSSFLSHSYSASHFAGVILTYITIITI